MSPEMTLWSYLTQWVGYIGWCVSAYDPACRPFAGFLALLGASAGMLSLLVIGLVSMLNSWEHEIVAARASATDRQRMQSVRDKLRHVQPAPNAAAGRPYAGHAEPLMPAGAALAMTAEPMHAAQHVAVPLQRIR